MNVKRLNGRLLNFWVAKTAQSASSGRHAGASGTARRDAASGQPYDPAGDWAQAGEIIANEWHAIENVMLEWFGPEWSRIPAISDKPLEWFMRAYVATQFGDEVEDISLAGLLRFEAGEMDDPARSPDSRSMVERWLTRLNGPRDASPRRS